MMQSIDSRGSDLLAYDAFAAELSRSYRGRLEAGAGVAGRDLERLCALAGRLGRELAAWSGAVGDLEGAAARPLAPRRAGRLLIESVFDEVLRPEATRVLAAALALACPAEA